jgi:hypothetical protein
LDIRVQFFLGRQKESLATLERALAIAPNDPAITELHDKVSRSAGREE